MFKTTQLSRLLVWLVGAVLLPLPLVATYLIGLTGVQSGSKLGVVYGIVAYVWLMLALYLSTKPKWVKALVGLPFASRMSHILSGVALLFTGFHTELSPAFGLVELTGEVALMVLVSAGLYWAVFSGSGLSKYLPSLSKLTMSVGSNRRLANFVQGLLAVSTGLVFVHTLVLPSLRSNLVFLVTFLVFSLPIFVAYAKSKRQQPAQEVASEDLVLTEQA